MKIGEYTYGVEHINVLWQNNDAKRELIIGKFCSIATNLLVYLGGNHQTRWISTFPFFILNSLPKAKLYDYETTNGSVVVGNDVWFGNNVTIQSGVCIGDGCIIAANSVVVKNCLPYCLYGGNPAKLIRQRFTDEQITDLIKIAWWDWDLNRINDNIHLLSSDNIQDFIDKNKNI